MADAEQVIRLSGDEDIHAVRTMLARAQAPRVMLVVPKGHEAFRRLVRLKMLARQAHDEGVQIALVTSDGRIRELADQLELSTFRSVEAGRKASRWRGGSQSTAAVTASGNQRVRLNNSLEWERGREAVLARQRQLGTQSNWTENIMLAGLLFGVMIIFAAILLLLAPSARVTLVPRQVPLGTTFPVVVDTSSREVDIFNGVVPADVVSVDVQGIQGIATTGRKDIPAARATGEVIFLNVTGQPVNIPANTIVSTSSGSSIRFRTTENASLPGEINARTSAPIEAINPGPSGNVRPLQINLVEGAAASAVRVLNESATEGGDVQQQAVVTNADKEQLLQQLRQLLLSQGQAELERSLLEDDGESESDRFIVPGTVNIEVTAETYSASLDDPADVLNLDLRARVSGIVVSRQDVERVARRTLRAEVPDDYRMLDDGFNVVTGESQRNEEGQLLLATRAEGLALAQISGNEIRRLVRGQPLDEAQAVLLQQLPLAADPHIDLSPDWWSRMPYLPLRIFIRVGVLGTNGGVGE